MIPIVASLLLFTGGSDEVTVEYEFLPRKIKASALTRDDFVLPDDFPDDLKPLFEQNVAWTQQLAFAIYWTATPPILMSAPEDDRNAPWLLYLAGHSTRLFRHRMQVEDRPYQPFMLYSIAGKQDYDYIVERICASVDYLNGWVDDAKSLHGIAVPQPSIVVSVEDGASVMGTNLENTLVHLTGHVLCQQYFKVQPFWLREGISLNLEVTAMDKLYAFCAGGDFSPLTRPGGWHIDVKKAWRREKSSLDLDHLTTVKQKNFDKRGCLKALGVVRYFQDHRIQELHRLMAGIAAETEIHLRQDRFYIAPSSKQIELMEENFGEGWETDNIETMKAGLSREQLSNEREWKALSQKEVTKMARISLSK